MLKIDGVQLIGINNRSLGTVLCQFLCACHHFLSPRLVFMLACGMLKFIFVAETFKVDTSITKMLLEKRGDIIREKGILVGLPYALCHHSAFSLILPIRNPFDSTNYTILLFIVLV